MPQYNVACSPTAMQLLLNKQQYQRIENGLIAVIHVDHSLNLFKEKLNNSGF